MLCVDPVHDENSLDLLVLGFFREKSGNYGYRIDINKGSISVGYRQG